jgi:hypothetical protein
VGTSWRNSVLNFLELPAKAPGKEREIVLITANVATIRGVIQSVERWLMGDELRVRDSRFEKWKF